MTTLENAMNGFQNYVPWGETLNCPIGSEAQMTWLKRDFWDDNGWNYRTHMNRITMAGSSTITCDRTGFPAISADLPLYSMNHCECKKPFSV